MLIEDSIVYSNKKQMKIFHFHLDDGMSNKSTLICELKDGAIKYRYFTGTGSSGIPLALSNLQVGYKHGCELPMDNLTTLGNKLSKKELVAEEAAKRNTLSEEASEP